MAATSRRFQNDLKRIGDGAARHLRPAWNALPSYDEDQIPKFSKRAVPILNAAKNVAVHHAAAFYAVSAGIAPVGVPASAVATVPDVRAPFISVWNALKSGEQWEAAVLAGAGRLDAIARDLVTSSSRQTGDLIVERAGLQIVGWVRVPDAGACEWCLEVAPGFYMSAESADFGHDRCGCTAEPIFA